MDASAIEFYDGDVAEGTDATRKTRDAHDLKKLPPLASSLATSSRLESGVQGGGQVGAARERAQRTRAGDPALAGGSRAQAPSSSGNLPPVLSTALGRATAAGVFDNTVATFAVLKARYATLLESSEGTPQI